MEPSWKPKSGYAAVHWDLCRTETAKTVVENVRSWAKKACVVDQTFEITTDENGLADTWTRWYVEFGPGLPQEFRNPQYTNFTLDIQHAVTDDVAKRIFSMHWKEDVGSRNCDRRIALRGREEERARGGWTVKDEVPSFYQALLDHVRIEAGKELQDGRQRVISQMIRICESDAFRSAREQALCDGAKKEIRRVMTKYRDVPDRVLKDAVGEALVEGIMGW